MLPLGCVDCWLCCLSWLLTVLLLLTVAFLESWLSWLLTVLPFLNVDCLAFVDCVTLVDCWLCCLCYLCCLYWLLTVLPMLPVLTVACVAVACGICVDCCLFSVMTEVLACSDGPSQVLSEEGFQPNCMYWLNIDGLKVCVNSQSRRRIGVCQWSGGTRWEWWCSECWSWWTKDDNFNNTSHQ